jgi:hypothetical protein
LWLTQEDPTTGGARFLSFMSPSELYGRGKGGMMPRKTKAQEPETVEEFLQAGTDGILTDQTGRAVYYSQYLNPAFAEFVTTHDLTKPATLAAFDPNTPFEDGLLELKVSWKIVADGEDVGSFFTTEADIDLLANKGGHIVTDPSRTEKVKLALVGFHIGGRVNGHPELIWASFEHVENAPNVPENPTPETVISDRNWTFYKAGTAYKDCNVNPANSPELKLDEATQILSPITQVCRLYEFGNDPSDPVNKQDSIKTNDANIALLNDEVMAKLKQAGDVWANYREVGAIWFLESDNLAPDLPLADDSRLTGSFKLSNATIETFTQSQSTMNNCFRCHNTAQHFPPATSMNPMPGLDLNVSRIIVNGYFWSQEAP